MGRVKTQCEKQFLKNNKVNYIMTIIALILSSAMSIALAFMLQFFVESVEYDSNVILKKGYTVGTAYLIIYGMFSFLQRNFKNTYLRKAMAQFKDYIFENILGKSIAGFGDGSSAKFISAFSNDLTSIETNYLAGTLNLIYTVILFVASTIASLYIQWQLAIPVLAFSIISILIS